MGPPIYLFETSGQDLVVLRQVDVYAGGQILRYDTDHLEDEYGGLAAEGLDATDFAASEVDAANFEAWSKPAVNRP